MADFDVIFRSLQVAIVSAANQEAGQYSQEVSSDAKDFLNQSKNDLQQWTMQLTSGDLTKEDFAYLVRGKKAVAEMKALTAVGMAAADIDRLRTTAIQTVIDCICKAIP